MDFLSTRPFSILRICTFNQTGKSLRVSPWYLIPSESGRRGVRARDVSDHLGTRWRRDRKRVPLLSSPLLSSLLLLFSQLPLSHIAPSRQTMDLPSFLLAAAPPELESRVVE